MPSLLLCNFFCNVIISCGMTLIYSFNMQACRISLISLRLRNWLVVEKKVPTPYSCLCHGTWGHKVEWLFKPCMSFILKPFFKSDIDSSISMAQLLTEGISFKIPLMKDNDEELHGWFRSSIFFTNTGKWYFSVMWGIFRQIVAHFLQLYEDFNYST